MRLFFSFFIFTFSLCFSQIVSYELVKSWTISDVENMYESNSFPSSVGQINFEVDGYKILYFTPNHLDQAFSNSLTLGPLVNLLLLSTKSARISLSD